MDQLDAGGELDVPRRARRGTAQPRGGQGEQRPQPLSAGREDMFGEPRNEFHPAAQAGDDDPVAGGKVLAEQQHQGRQRVLAVRRLALVPMGCSGPHAAFILGAPPFVKYR